MNNPERIKHIAFADGNVKKAFDALKSGRTEEQELLKFIERAIKDLKDNPFCGIRIPSKFWPKEYVRKYRVENLLKYDMPNAWRLIYTVRGTELEIISILIEWFNHKEYERRFGY